MLGVSAGKVVGAAEILLRTHVEIVVVDVVEHGINAGNSRDADRPWRQSWVAIGVVGAADAEARDKAAGQLPADRRGDRP